MAHRRRGSAGQLLATTLLLCGAHAAAGGMPNDTNFHCQWGLNNSGQTESCDVVIPPGQLGADISALAGWAIHPGAAPIIVAIVGQGIDPHAEYADRLLPGRSFVDDPYDTRDKGALGTAIAGIIGADRGNEWGIAGLNDRVWLLPVRVFGGTGSTSHAAHANGINWAVSQGATIVVVISQLATSSEPLQEAVTNATAAGTLVVAPAGNDGSTDGTYPASYTDCLGVGATTNADGHADFSNSGAHVGIAAPGELIHSTSAGNSFDTRSATALAAGYVAGVASLIQSYAPQLSAAELRAVMESTADDLGPAGWDDQFGHGRIDAAAALEAAPLPPLRLEVREPLPVELVPGRPTNLSLAIIDGTEAYARNSGRLLWRTGNAVFQSSPLESRGDTITNATLPALPCGVSVEYYFEATGDSGSVVTHPIDAPAVTHSAVATSSNMAYEDDFESETRWTTSEDEGTDPRGAWVRVEPNGTVRGIVQAQPEYDRSPNAGQRCFITGQYNGGGIHLTDVDGPAVRLTSPPISVHGPDSLVSFAVWVSSTGAEGHTADELQVELSYGDDVWTTVAWIGNTSGWEQRSFLLSDVGRPIEPDVQVRFSIADDPNDSLTEAAIDNFSVRDNVCGTSPGDFNGDGYLNLPDHYALTTCFLGPEIRIPNEGCRIFDLDNDDDVDLRDSAILQDLFSTPQ